MVTAPFLAQSKVTRARFYIGLQLIFPRNMVEEDSPLFGEDSISICDTTENIESGAEQPLESWRRLMFLVCAFLKALLDCDWKSVTTTLGKWPKQRCKCLLPKTK